MGDPRPRWLEFADYPQGSTEWLDLKARPDFVTSTTAIELLLVGYSNDTFSKRRKGVLVNAPVSPWVQSMFDVGHRGEEHAVQWITKMAGPRARFYPGATVVHPKYRWLGATSDGLVVQEGNLEWTNLEVKTQRMHRDDCYDVPTQVPARYLLQCQLQMACMADLPHHTTLVVWKGQPGEFARQCIRPENGTQVYKVYYNPELANWAVLEVGRILRCFQDGEHPYPRETMKAVRERHCARVEENCVYQFTGDFSTLHLPSAYLALFA